MKKNKFFKILDLRDLQVKEAMTSYHRMLHVAYSYCNKDDFSVMSAESNESVPRVITPEFIRSQHESVVEKLVKDGKHYIKDELDFYLTKGMRDASVQETATIRDYLWDVYDYNIEEKLIDNITTVEMAAILRLYGDSVPVMAKYLPREQCDAVLGRNKKMILSSVKFSKHLDKYLLLADRHKAYGTIVMKNVQEIKNHEDFINSSDKHKITMLEKKAWWGDKWPLYGYDCEVVKELSVPIKYKYIKGFQNFASIEKFRVLKETLSEIDLGENYTSYCPTCNTILTKEAINLTDSNNCVLCGEAMESFFGKMFQVLKGPVDKIRYLEYITPANLEKSSRQELVIFHTLLHNLFISPVRRGIDLLADEDIFFLHESLTGEIEKRGMEHVYRDRLDELTVMEFLPETDILKPYSTGDTNALPEYVQKLTKEQQSVWIRVFNSTYNQCINKRGRFRNTKKGACESNAFRTANGVIKRQKKA